MSNKNKKLIYIGPPRRNLSENRTYISRGETRTMFYINDDDSKGRWFQKNLFTELETPKT